MARIELHHVARRYHAGGGIVTARASAPAATVVSEASAMCTSCTWVRA